MDTQEFNNLMQAVTGRRFSFKLRVSPISEQDFAPGDEVPLEAKVAVYRPRRDGLTWMFDWSTPKSEDNLARSFITAFCSRWREPNPATYGNSWQNYARDWETDRDNSVCWYHHASHMLTPKELRESVMQTAASVGYRTWAGGFYPTNYGIGIFIVYACAGTETAILEMREFLKSQGVTFTNQLSEKGWVLRFRIERSKPDHIGLVQKFKAKLENN